MINKVSATIAAVLLAGCGASPHLHVGNAIVNMGQDLPAKMVNVNLAGTVAFDEAPAAEYNRVTKNRLYVMGIVEGSPEYNYRVVPINTFHLDGALYWSPGEHVFYTGALVPDSIPRLRAGDVVEFRNTGTWRTMENFSKTGEGNVVLRVLCRVDEANYRHCVDNKTPAIGKLKARGLTGTPYLPSVANYNFKFSPNN